MRLQLVMFLIERVHDRKWNGRHHWWKGYSHLHAAVPGCCRRSPWKNIHGRTNVKRTEGSFSLRRLEKTQSTEQVRKIYKNFTILTVCYGSVITSMKMKLKNGELALDIVKSFKCIHGANLYPELQTPSHFVPSLLPTKLQ